MKNNLPYFAHYSSTHNQPVMQALLAEYGFEGYGKYWFFCEKIASCPNAVLDISSRVIRLTIARDMGMSAEEFDSFIRFLNAPDIKLVKFENGIITTDFLQEDYQKVLKKRNRDRSEKNPVNDPLTVLQFPIAENSKPTTENTQSRVDKSREEKTIQDQSIEDQSTENSKKLSDHFLHIWKQNSDVFNLSAKIKSQQDWESFWKTCNYSGSDIDTMMKNYIGGVKNGDIERRFIPRSPDVFVKNGHLQTSVEPYNYKKSKHRIANDYVDEDDLGEYFTEADDLPATTDTEETDF
jgi:hypothetical protein